MRPLRLEVSGLTCFREPQTIDFAALALVAIEGPTGAGKSSLLDAMILALYGVVPRMGAQNLHELISHGRSGLAVKFDFELRGTRWRVARTVNNRGRPSQAILSELVDGVGDDGEAKLVEKKKFDGVIEVQKEVKSLLGIDARAFQQAVILPQGKFQEFLQSTPGERRKILTELLGFQVYATMRHKAAEIATRLGAQVDALARQLAGDLALANAELIAELELQFELARSEREASRVADEAGRGALAEVERIAQKCAELLLIDQALTVLQAREAEVVALEKKVERARAALPVLPIVQRVTAGAPKVEALQERARGAGERATAAERAVEVAADAVRDAEIAGEQIAALRARIAQLDEARGRFEQRDELSARAAKVAADLALAAGVLREHESASASAEIAREVIVAALASLEREEVPAVAAELLATWEAARELAGRLAAARVAHEREREAVAAAKGLIARSEEELTDAELERKKKEHGEMQADEALEAARAALGKAEHEGRVALVREHLHAGEACPVCEQVVLTVPGAVVGGEIAALREAVAKAKTAGERARGEAERARARAAEARARGQQAGARLAEVEAALAKIADEIAREERALAEVVGAGAAGDATPVEARFRRGLEALSAAARRRSEHELAIAAKRAELDRLTLIYESKRAAAVAAKARVDELAISSSDTAARLASVEASLASLGAQDPKKERASLERVIAGIEARQVNAAAALAAARAIASRAGAERDATIAAHTDAEAEQRRAEAELGASGWTIDAVHAATMSDAALAAADAEVGAHRAARAARVAERESVVRALGPARAGEAEVEAARHALEQAAARATRAAEHAAVLGERLRQAHEQLERAGGVRAEHEAKVKQLTVYKRVADDLSPRNFQEFLLEEVIADLVRGASERLFGLSSGRYRMAADSAAGFLVIDMEHAGERRSTDTLSGGETFLASLAMALELSEQIRAKAGRVDLDCIFIDEGFGTLDPETLETVAEAVEGLQRPGRLVGIITHVAELAARMPERLLVEKSATGSVVRVISAS